ncbi:unnamed protein product, partial [Rotaria sp. Silwood2]
MISLFDDLPDLILLEIFSYLCCVDALWSFSNLNSCLTTLLKERESLVIDRCASPLQLRRWSHLTNLTTLRLQGVRNFRNVFKFAIKHVNTLSHFTVQSSGYFRRVDMIKKRGYPLWNLKEFVEKILCYLPTLQSLDLGMETSFYLHKCPFQTISTPLIYLKISINRTLDVIDILSTKPLSHTLKQLHIKMPDFCGYRSFSSFDKNTLPRIESLHTFIFAKSFKWHSSEKWSFVNVLTTCNVMPMLRPMNFSLFINVNNLYQMNNSLLFNDHCHINVHYAFIIHNNRQHCEFNQHVPRDSLSHRRQIANATFISEYWPADETFMSHKEIY